MDTEMPPTAPSTQREGDTHDLNVPDEVAPDLDESRPLPDHLFTAIVVGVMALLALCAALMLIAWWRG